MKRKRKTLGQVILHVILISIAGVAILPFLSMIATSLMDIGYVLPDAPPILPKAPFFFQNFTDAWNGSNFKAYFLNSLILASSGTVINMTVSTITAYGFSRFNFPGKEKIFNLFLLTMMIPAMLAIIPQYTVINSMGLVDKYAGILLLYAAGCVTGNTFFFRGFFESIPRELEESVKIDGGNRWHILKNIILPLSKPAIGTMAIFAFTGYWGDLFTILTFIKTEEKRTLPVALQLFKGQHTTNYGMLFAASLIVLVPIIVIFIIFQKQFMKQGLSDGAVKG